MAMMRFRQRKMLRWPSRNRKTRSLRTPTTWTGVSPMRSVRPSASPLGKKTATASVPRIATGVAESMSCIVKSRP